MRLSTSPDPGFLITGDGAASSVRRRTAPRLQSLVLAGGVVISIGIGAAAISVQSDREHTLPLVAALDLARLSPRVELRLSHTPKSAAPRRTPTRHTHRSRAGRPAAAAPAPAPASSPSSPAPPVPAPVPVPPPALAVATPDGPGEFF